MVESASDAVHAMLAALLLPGELELAFGRVTAREGCNALLTERRFLWGWPSRPTRVGALELATVTSYQEVQELHRWSVRLRHAEMTQRVHVPAHGVLWWSWGNAEAPVTFTQTEFRFSRRDTVLARALRELLVASGASHEPTVTVSTSPRPERVHSVPLRRVTHPRLHRLQRRMEDTYEDLYRGHLYWRWRLLGWAVFGLPLLLVSPWLGLLGVLVFELLVIGLMQLSWYGNIRRQSSG